MTTQEEKDEVSMNTEYDRQREDGVHRQKYGMGCRCSDCLREREKQDRDLVENPF